MQAENDQLADILRDKDEEIERMGQALAEREAPKAMPTLHSKAAQTVEPYPDNVCL